MGTDGSECLIQLFGCVAGVYSASRNHFEALKAASSKIYSRSSSSFLSKRGASKQQRGNAKLSHSQAMWEEARVYWAGGLDHDQLGQFERVVGRLSSTAWRLCPEYGIIVADLRGVRSIKRFQFWSRDGREIRAARFTGQGAVHHLETCADRATGFGLPH